MSTQPMWLGTEQVSDMPVAEAIQVLEETLLNGLDPEYDGQRSRIGAPSGQLLQMPSATNEWCGTKLITLRESAELENVPAIQGLYALFDGTSLTPTAILEGAGLTTLRTPAMTALAIKHLTSETSGRVALFGTGVQARAHVDALLAVFSPESIAVVGRNVESAARLVDAIETRGVESYVAQPEIVSEMDVVVCCTASDKPLFDGGQVQDHAVVAAIGSHDPYSREVDSTLVQRASVVVESRDSAQREAGDLMIPHKAGEFDWDRAVTIREIILGEQVVDFTRPRLFKGTGMPWQDLAVASSAYLRAIAS